jgi:translation initiation factor 2B subunit (eIF-2B alpha/beta/delta family)
LTFGCSHVVERVLFRAHEAGISFRVVVADSRPRLEGPSGAALARVHTHARTHAHTRACTLTHIRSTHAVHMHATGAREGSLCP